MSNQQTALVLEGGGMRGVYTAGVLDRFLEEELEFDTCYGVSAGACHACSFLSRQHGRAFAVNVDYLKDSRYLSVKSWLKTGDLFGAKMLYDIIPNQLNLYDYDAFAQNPTKFFAVATDCLTGKAEYFPVTEMHRDVIKVRASSSLPLLSRMVEINGRPYLDGGLADSIPVDKAKEDGATKQVVVLTRQPGYRKKQSSSLPLVKLRYRHFPNLVHTVATRHIRYNRTVEEIEAAKGKGELFVIQPRQPLEVGRTEKNRDKLTAAYLQGWRDAEWAMADLRKFLGL